MRCVSSHDGKRCGLLPCHGPCRRIPARRKGQHQPALGAVDHVAARVGAVAAPLRCLLRSRRAGSCANPILQKSTFAAGAIHPYGWFACGPVTSTSGPSQWPARRMARRRTRGSSARFGVPRLVYARPSSAAARGRRATKYAADQFTRGSTDAVARKSASRMSAVRRIGQPRSAAPSSAHVGLSPTCLFHPTAMREGCNATGTGRPDRAVRSASLVFQPVLHVPPCGGGRRLTLSDEHLGDRGGLVR